MKSSSFWDIPPCTPMKASNDSEKHLHNRSVRQQKTSRSWRKAHLNLPLASACLFFGLLVDPEDGGDMFLTLKRLDRFELHGVTTPTTVLFIVTSVRTSSPLMNSDLDKIMIQYVHHLDRYFEFPTFSATCKWKLTQVRDHRFTTPHSLLRLS
jgi:hypothetical protein